MPALLWQCRAQRRYDILHEAHPRIEAGIDYLKKKGADRIILIAHSCSVHMSMAWLDAHGDHRIAGYIGLGMGATDYKQPMRAPFPLEKLHVPILDVYGDEDYPAVQRLAPERMAAILAAGNPKSEQVVVPGADHYFKDHDDALLEVVNTWLDSL